jgi:cyclopropane-fatty-acyl-phospholipid synthase
MLERIIASGDITFIDSRGRARRFGDGTGPPVAVRFTDRATELALAFNPELAAGEAYMDGRLVMEAGSVYDFIALVMRNLEARRYPRWSRVFAALRRLARPFATINPRARSRLNVRHHYDIDPAIYELFLDPDRQYSCAYFTPGAGLTGAQLAKKRHIAAKLAIEPGMRVLDIGSGWGGLAIYLARATGADVTGVTLSLEQLVASQSRAEKEGLADRVRFEPRDYREATGSYDRVVSVGMFEHVGRAHYATFFRKVAALLEDDGVALIHTIGRTDGPSATNPFIARYIFPGGYLPSLSEIAPAVERSGLVLADVEVLRLHYAETLRAWRERFMANRARAVDIAGERFCRMWEFYLAGCEAAFRHERLAVFQLQLERRLGTLPITRDYMLDTERRLALRDAGGGERPRLAGE